MISNGEFTDIIGQNDQSSTTMLISDTLADTHRMMTIPWRRSSSVGIRLYPNSNVRTNPRTRFGPISTTWGT